MMVGVTRIRRFFLQLGRSRCGRAGRRWGGPRGLALGPPFSDTFVGKAAQNDSLAVSEVYGFGLDGSKSTHDDGLAVLDLHRSCGMADTEARRRQGVGGGDLPDTEVRQRRGGDDFRDISVCQVCHQRTLVIVTTYSSMSR